MKKFAALSAFLFFSLFFNALLQAQIKPTVPTDQKLINCLRAFYPLNNNGIDHGGNNLNGTIYNVTPTTDRHGFADSCYSFNGTTSYINLPDAFDLQVKTINVWFYAQNINTTPDIVYGSDHAGIAWGLTSIFVVDQAGEKMLCYNQGANFKYTKINQNEWYMATMVRGVTLSKFYLNGVLVDSVPAATGHSWDGQATAKIGCGRSVNQYFFNGKIDELRIYNCALTLSEIQGLYDFVEPSCVKAIYPLNGNTLDISGNNYNGTLHGAIPTTDRFGEADSAYYFEGNSAYIDLPSDFDLQQKSINVWFKAQNIGTDPDIIYGSDHAAIQYGITSIFVVDMAGVKKICFDQGTTARYAVINQNEWYMASFVQGLAYTKFYLNSVLVDSVPTTNGHSANGQTTAKIGCGRNANQYFFNGKIDDLRIFSCTISQSEIDSLYVTGSESCLKAFYPLNNSSLDHSGNNYHGIDHYAVTAIDRFGSADSAYMFDGTTSYIDLPDAFDYQEKTINVWFYAQNITSDPDIIYGSDHASIQYGITSIFVVDMAGVKKICFDQGTTARYANINQNQWYMASMTRGVPYTKFYLNSVLVDSVLSGTGHSANGQTTAKIGCSRNANTYFFNGKIDELRIYDCVFGPDEIGGLYITSVEDHLANPDLMKIFPNPASEFITIDYSGGTSPKVELSVINLQGQEMIHQQTQLKPSQKLDVGELKAGVYFLKVTGDKVNFSKKIVIQR
jgi:hypothetical protein